MGLRWPGALYGETPLLPRVDGSLAGIPWEKHGSMRPAQEEQSLYVNAQYNIKGCCNSYATCSEVYMLLHANTHTLDSLNCTAS